jgi:ABC-type proline/glycine betaine transport system permease subunit
VTYLATHPGRVGELLGQHLVLVLVSLAVAIVIAIPLGIVAARCTRSRALRCSRS